MTTVPPIICIYCIYIYMCVHLYIYTVYIGIHTFAGIVACQQGWHAAFHQLETIFALHASDAGWLQYSIC